MKTFYITFKCKGRRLEEFVQGSTNTKAIKKLMDSLRQRGLPVNIEILKVELIKIIL
jgi:hypothetical protein